MADGAEGNVCNTCSDVPRLVWHIDPFARLRQSPDASQASHCPPEVRFAGLRRLLSRAYTPRSSVSASDTRPSRSRSTPTATRFPPCKRKRRRSSPGWCSRGSRARWLQAAELSEEVESFLALHNEVRPHQALQQKRPLVVRRADPHLDRS